jgi:outer membrane usher protein FimD/PapC
MDPTAARILDDLKDLLERKVISFAEYREAVAAVLREAEEQRQKSVNVSLSNVVRDESVNGSVSLSTVKGDDENEYTFGVGVSAMPGKSQHVQEDVRVVSMSMSNVGDRHASVAKEVTSEMREGEQGVARQEASLKPA